MAAPRAAVAPAEEGPKEICPTCKHVNNQQATDERRLKVSPCGHVACETCLRKRYMQKERMPCSTCRKPLKLTEYIFYNADDSAVVYESKVRKRVISQYNKARQDFESDGAYNDYLEEVEDLIFHWVNVNADEASEQLERYRKENEVEIRRRHARAAQSLGEVDAPAIASQAVYGSVGGVAMPQALRMTGPTAMFARLNGAVDGSAVEPPPAKVSTPERSRDKAMSAGGYEVAVENRRERQEATRSLFVFAAS